MKTQVPFSEGISREIGTLTGKNPVTADGEAWDNVLSYSEGFSSPDQ